MAQGYGIGRPMLVDHFDAWAAAWLPDPGWINVRRIERDEIPLLFASVEHRAWIAAVEGFLRRGQGTVPDVDPGRCRFGKWLQSEDADRFRAIPAFGEIVAMHDEVHATAADLVRQRSRSDGVAPSAMKRLFELRDALIEKLLGLLDGHDRPAVAIHL